MKKHLIISLLFVVLINSGAGCGNSSDQTIAPVAPNYLGTWGTNEDGCTGDPGSMNEETLEITEGKIVYIQPEITKKICPPLNTPSTGYKIEFTYTVDRDNVIKITDTIYIQKISNGAFADVTVQKGLGIWKSLPQQLFNKDLSSKFTCDGKILKFETFGTPIYLKRK